MTMSSRHWRNFWARKRNVCEQRVRELSTLIDAHAGLSLTQTIPSCQIARLTRWCVPPPDWLTSCPCWPSWLILISAITMISTMMMWSLTLCRSTHCPQSCLARLMLIRRWSASNSPAESDRVESRTSDLPSLFVNEQQVSTDRRPNLPQANSLENLPPSSFPSRLCHFCSSHLLLLTLIRGGSSLWSNPSSPRDHENPASKILDSRCADLGGDHVTVYISLWHKTTAALPPPPVRRLLSAPSHGGARCSRSSYRVWVSRRTYLEHILTRVFFHTRGPPGTKSDKVPLFPEHPTCHPWGPPCFREPFFFHQSSEEKLRFSSI